MKLNENTIIKVFYLILFPTVLLFLIVHVSVATGVMKEREQRQCITSLEASRWQSVISVAEGIYLNVSKDYQTNLETLEGSVKYWRGSSSWYSDQLDSCQEGNEFLQEQLFDEE